jgi:hypothetical protein
VTDPLGLGYRSVAEESVDDINTFRYPQVV